MLERGGRRTLIVVVKEVELVENEVLSEGIELVFVAWVMANLICARTEFILALRRHEEASLIRAVLSGGGRERLGGVIPENGERRVGEGGRRRVRRSNRDNR